MQVQPPPTMLFWAPLGGTLYRGLPSNEPETPFADGLKFATDSQLYASNAATAGRGIVFEYMFSKPGAYVTFEWCVWHAKKPMPHCAWPPWVRNWLRTAAATDASLGVTDAQATEYLTTAVQGLLTNGTVVLGLRRPRREQLAAGGSAEFITPNFQRLEQWTLASQVEGPDLEAEAQAKADAEAEAAAAAEEEARAKAEAEAESVDGLKAKLKTLRAREREVRQELEDLRDEITDTKAELKAAKAAAKANPK
eukprot:m.18316 g.18316  ORF g.18316 m.18316 type:complete len:252 (+) comp5299_c0_seq2:211-966(+)